MDYGDYNSQGLKVHYAQSPTGGVPETMELHWGTSPGTLPNLKTVPWVQDWSTPLKTLLPGPGTYYAKAKVLNRVGSLESPEYPFECLLSPDGSLELSLG